MVSCVTHFPMQIKENKSGLNSFTFKLKDVISWGMAATNVFSYSFSYQVKDVTNKIVDLVYLYELLLKMVANPGCG